MKKHLLIAEDESLIRYSLVTALQSDSVQVTTAANGANALKEITVFPDYDLYIIDLSLPDMNGEELMKKIRKTQPEAKLIVLTGRFLNKEAMLDSMRTAAELEPFYFICKPFELKDVQEVVFQALFS